jgi:type II secretory pathway pseudopilin PulG
MVEVMVSLGVLAMLMLGLFAALLQSRRLTEASIYQNSANTIIQGYIEQMKNMEFEELSRTVIPTRLDESTLDPLTPSTVAVINPNTVVLGTIPTGVTNNVKVVDVNNTPTITTDDLTLNIWIWVQGMDSPAAASLAQSRVLGITMIYVWEHRDGQQIRRFLGTVRTIRSFVPTF